MAQFFRDGLKLNDPQDLEHLEHYTNIIKNPLALKEYPLEIPHFLSLSIHVIPSLR
jgi:hypothetical protein